MGLFSRKKLQDSNSPSIDLQALDLNILAESMLEDLKEKPQLLGDLCRHCTVVYQSTVEKNITAGMAAHRMLEAQSVNSTDFHPLRRVPISDGVSTPLEERNRMTRLAYVLEVSKSMQEGGKETVSWKQLLQYAKVAQDKGLGTINQDEKSTAHDEALIGKALQAAGVKADGNGYVSLTQVRSQIFIHYQEAMKDCRERAFGEIKSLIKGNPESAIRACELYGQNGGGLSFATLAQLKKGAPSIPWESYGRALSEKSSPSYRLTSVQSDFNVSNVSGSGKDRSQESK